MVSLSQSVKVLLISSGVLFTALLLKVSVPLAVDFSVSQAPIIWSSVASWLRPPYLYVIINCIIITIAATSRFHHHDKHVSGHQQEVPPEKDDPISLHEDRFDYQVKVSAAEIRSGFVGVDSTAEEEEGVVSTVFEDKNTVVVVNGSTSEVEYRDEDEFVISRPEVNASAVEVEDREEEEEGEFVISRSAWMPPKRIDSSENLLEISFPAEKPLVSTRFGHRKPVRASPEGGRALRVSKPKRHETLENTWKAITVGRAMPLNRHLKKSDTWENHGRQVNVPLVDPYAVKKSDTFKDRTNYQSPGVDSSPPSGRLRKEPSLSQDELNRRVEAFIKNFNEEMRIQRQESLNQYKEMISYRG